MSSTTVEASYRTAGGRIIEVKTELDSGGNTVGWSWRCPGCQTPARIEYPYTLQAFTQSAQDHAATCHAL